jgi:hypothetical protein
MKKIFKYEIPVEGVELDMPRGARILSCQNQHDNVCLWALVDPDAAKEERHFVVAGTGHPLDDSIVVAKYLGTVVVAGGQFVWHVFEVTPNRG